VKLSLLIALTLFLPQCKSKVDDSYKYHYTLSHQVETFTGVFPIEVDLAPTRVRLIEEAESLRQIFPTSEVVRLEVQDEAVIAYIHDIAFIGDNWFILDNIQGLIFQFSKEGRFIRRLGRKGEGPGEYYDPDQVFPCFDDNVGLYDLLTGNIIVFNTMGHHIRTVHARSREPVFIPNGSIVWHIENQLYLPNFDSLNRDAPWHVLLNPVQVDQTPVGFGKREVPFSEIPWAMTAFAQVGDFIWSGSPYESKLEIYDLQGRHAGTLETAQINGLGLEELDDDLARDRKKRRQMFNRPRNVEILAVSDIVLVRMGLMEYCIFDRGGNLLRSNLRTTDIFPIMHSHEDWVVSPLPVLEKPEHYSAEDLRAMKVVGWTPEGMQDDNPYLRIGKIAK